MMHSGKRCVQHSGVLLVIHAVTGQEEEEVLEDEGEVAKMEKKEGGE